MSPEEKREEMFESWLSPQRVEFTDIEAENMYKERVTRLIKVINLEVPDRIPVYPSVGFFPAYYAGITPREAMYDYEKLVRAWKKYHFDFSPDINAGMGIPGPGKTYDDLDYKLYAWPGHGVPHDATYQCIEKEYMKANEYEALIQDPSDFWLRIYLPRVFGSLEPLKQLSPFTHLIEWPNVGPGVLPFGKPEVKAAFEALFEAGEQAVKWATIVGNAGRELMACGFPVAAGGMAKAPFDTIGDTLRGTRGVVMDMYRQPEKLHEAMEKITPLMINMAVSSARVTGNPIIFIPLHKGAEGFMSDEQYKTFYWPTLKKVILGLIEEGLVPRIIAEGAYEARLEIIKDIPAGKTIWKFDHTNMAKAKEMMGRIACIEGNVPISLLTVGTPEQVKGYCKHLIEVAGKNGGFILSSASAVDQGKQENLRVMIEFTKEYGVYS